MLKYCFSLLLVFQGYAFAQPRLIDKVVAVVGDRMVMLSDIQQQKLQLIQNKVPVDNETDCYLLDELIFQKLLLHQADIDSVEITDEQVEAELNNKITYYRRLLEQYGKTLEEEYGMSEAQIKEEFRPAVRERLLSETMEGKLSSGITVSPKEIKEYYESIPQDSLPRMNMQVEFSHIVIYPEINKAAEEDAVRKLNESKEGAEKGEYPFSFYATLYSEDPGSKNNGGDFGCVSKGMFVPEFDAVALSMEEGAISDPFKTQYGWHILKLNERRGETYCGAHILVTPRVGEEEMLAARKKLDSLGNAIKAGEISFEVAARKISADEDSKSNGGKVYNFQQGSFRWDVADLDRDVAMMLEQMEVMQLSSVVSFTGPTGRRGYRLVRLTLRRPPHVANLNDDYPLFQQATIGHKKEKANRNWYIQKAQDTHVWVGSDYSECPFAFRNEVSD